ncbi:MAG TPA: maleylpyruvate isomerase N-terminal domain-containing protein [Streptosporangiaceae bacterium]|jgi:uncharacterized protein (TIGR03083 family)
MAEPRQAALAVQDAFRAECERLTRELASADDASFSQASPCPPWTVGELLYHVRIAVGRLPAALAGPAPQPGSVPLTSAGAYYRDDHRFSASTNTGRITLAQAGAAAAAPDGAGPAALVRDFGQTWRAVLDQVQATSPDRVVRTRHGDYMLLTEFLRTRVAEVAVHGLDLAAGLDREPWLTGPAAVVVADLLLPAAAADGLRAELGWDQLTLIAKGTGRAPLTGPEGALVTERGISWPSFG